MDEEKEAKATLKDAIVSLEEIMMTCQRSVSQILENLQLPMTEEELGPVKQGKSLLSTRIAQINLLIHRGQMLNADLEAVIQELLAL